MVDPAAAAASPVSQSFLVKYWYIVLALMLYLNMGSGGAAPSEKAGAEPAAAPAAK